MRIALGGNGVFAQDGGHAHEAGKPFVVLVHGAGMDHTVWQQQSRYLAHHGWNVLAVDLPGHGASDGAPLDSVEALADWVAALLDATGIAEAALVGHSLGALTALEAAARHPGKVAKLALLGVTPTMPVHDDLLSAAESGDPLAVELIVGWGFGKRAHKGGNVAPGIWMTGGGGRLLEHAPPGVLGTDLAAANAYAGGLDAAAKVSCPTLLLLGAADRMTPVRGAAPLQSAIADCRTVVLPDAGHMMMIEAPRATLRALIGFLGPGA